MKRTKVNLSEERRILARCIVDTSFLSQVARVAEPSLFESRFCQQVATWTWEYLAQTTEAPGRCMEEIFLRRRKELRDEDEQELIEEFLQALSKDWDKPGQTNLDYGIDTAVAYFKIQSLKHLSKQLEAAVTGGDPARGEQLLSQYKRVEAETGQGIRLLYDTNAVVKAFDQEHQELFRFQGALHESLGPVNRGDFVSFAAPMKRGKTFWLQYAATRSMMAGNKTLVINCEMMADEITERFWLGLMGQPSRPMTLKRPTFKKLADAQFSVTYPEIQYPGVDLANVARDQAWIRQSISGDLRVEIFPNGGRTVADIEALLINLEVYEDWVPDVLVLDYADLLAAENGRLEGRFALDSIWKRLRGLAQDRKIAVVTASQTDRGTLDKDARAGNMAEHIGKVAHVTKLVMLNQTETEREHGIMRVNCPIRRKGATKHAAVVVLECRELGRAYLDSRWIDEVESDAVERETSRKSRRSSSGSD